MLIIVDGELDLLLRIVVSCSSFCQKPLRRNQGSLELPPFIKLRVLQNCCLPKGKHDLTCL